jgi:hypothetical protein
MRELSEEEIVLEEASSLSEEEKRTALVDYVRRKRTERIGSKP